MTRIITLTGGENTQEGRRLAVDLAGRMAAAGTRVCLVTLAGAANRDNGAKRWPDVTTLADSLTGHGRFSLLQLAPGCDLVVGCREARWLSTLRGEQLEIFGERLRQLAGYDFLIIDAGRGSDPNRLALLLASSELLLTVTPAPDSLAAAYGLLKLLYAEQFAGSIRIVVNQCDSADSGRHTHEKLRSLAGFYLEMPLPLLATLEPPEGTGNGAYASGVAEIERRLREDSQAPQQDMDTFSRRFLVAAGLAAEPEEEQTPVDGIPRFRVPTRHKELQAELDRLASQVDDLIAEVGRLRGDAPARQRPAAPQDPAPSAPRRCDIACIADLADASQPVTVAGETFTVFSVQRAQGELRFAYQSIDDDLEEPEPQSSLS